MGLTKLNQNAIQHIYSSRIRMLTLIKIMKVINKTPKELLCKECTSYIQDDNNKIQELFDAEHKNYKTLDYNKVQCKNCDLLITCPSREYIMIDDYECPFSEEGIDLEEGSPCYTHGPGDKVVDVYSFSTSHTESCGHTNNYNVEMSCIRCAREHWELS